MQGVKNRSGGEALLKVKDIRKSFGSNEVLKGINMELREGEVIALIGGNGAGKSTLMKIIMGIYQQDEGEIYINGEKVDISKSSTALANGIYLVPQEPMLFPNMTVEENVAMGFDEKKSEIHKRMVEMIEHLGWDLKLERKANTLSIAEQQLVEILKGLLRNARILILDEPTSSLSFNEAESLFKLVEELKQKNIGIFYITHRLTEVFQIATHVSIMRDGVVSLSGEVSEFEKSHLVKALLPPDSELKTAGERVEIDYTSAEPVLELKDFSGSGFSTLNLAVY
ncbi:ATP-binding cassette domain-containing protein, partial [[Clostridium] hylemonae]|uniref:ATP-binding cassette domain-containing protein n=1 Tax=[Clostridium] hylemonae TaxID=89153 RepID=UPI00399199A1